MTSTKHPIGAASTPADLRAVLQRARRVASDPESLRKAAIVLVPILIAVGLLLPPVSLFTRLATIGFVEVRPDGSMTVGSNVAGTQLSFGRVDVPDPTHVRIRVLESAQLPRGVGALPAGHGLLSVPIQLAVRGPVPLQATLSTPLNVRPEDVPFVDAYGWDGDRWRWLSATFDTVNWARVYMPLQAFVPKVVVLTKVGDLPTEVAVTLLPPPATVPAAVAELPILEMRAYGIQDSDGRVAGEAFTVPSKTALRYGVIDNVEGTRIRTDLVGNILIRPEARRNHRQAIADLVRRDDLDGIVLDYSSVPTDLHTEYTDFARLLAGDLHRVDAKLVVVVPMPQPTASGWTSGGYDWRALGAAADGVRVRLPTDAPVPLETLDDLARWALTQVERGKVQLAVPAQGRDIVGGEVTPISFGAAVRRVIDLAESDAPARLSPGENVTVDLPTMRAAEMARDPATGAWRFNTWDQNRRQHTIWLADAAGHRPVFDIASRYGLGAVVLDGVSADMDPALWNMVRTFAQNGVAETSSSDYRLRWQLTDERGQVLQETTHSLGGASFSFSAPDEDGTYRLLVDLISADGRPVALGGPTDVRVAPPPPPTPRPTLPVFYVAPTPIPYVTAPAPADELRLQRTPVLVVAAPTATPTSRDTPGTPGPSASPTPPRRDVARVAVAEAVLRAGPSIGTEVVSDLRAGDELEIVGRAPASRWLYARVVKTGVEGWVLAEVVELGLSLAELPILVTPTPEPTP